MQAVATSVKRRFTAQEYEQLLAIGILREDERVELLDGEITIMAAMSVSHSMIRTCLNRLVIRQVPPDLRVGVQIPILLNDLSEPEPDLFIFHDRKYATHPTPADILLVVEIADCSLTYDRDRKFPRYAEAGIPEAWLFDILAGVLERHTASYAGRYREMVTAHRGEALISLAVPGLTLAVDEILAEGA